ncbi:MAG: hypothetical protein ACLR1V_05795 [Coprococcus sp.]
MAHVKNQYDVMDAFCMDVFRNSVSQRMKAVLFPMFYYFQMFMASNPTAHRD